MARHEEATIFQSLGEESGCKGFAQALYERIANEPVLKPLFPGKSHRCAIEEFTAFLIQFFDGDEEQTQYRWWLSLGESHHRFKISEVQRMTWLKCMHATIDSKIAELEPRAALHQFFDTISLYVVGSGEQPIENQALASRWRQQSSLDRLVESIVNWRDADAISLAKDHANRRTVFVGILARMMEARRELLIEFVLKSIASDPRLAHSRFNGRFLLHFAAGSNCLPVVRSLLAAGTDPDILDSGNHTPLYRVANQSGTRIGAEIVRELVRAGANVDHCGGVTRSTALHAAARQGHLAVVQALLEAGASGKARDKKGFTPLDRANNCRRREVAAVLSSRIQT